MRWKCDTVRWDSCLGLYRGVEVCVTYFQRLLAAPRTAAEDCYDSFPLRAQESIFSPRHFYSSSVTLIFPFSTVFAMVSVKQPRLGFAGLKKRRKTLLFFWITLGRYNYSVLQNTAPERSHYLMTDIRKTTFDLASSLTTLLWDFWQLYQIRDDASG